MFVTECRCKDKCDFRCSDQHLALHAIHACADMHAAICRPCKSPTRPLLPSLTFFTSLAYLASICSCHLLTDPLCDDTHVLPYLLRPAPPLPLCHCLIFFVHVATLITLMRHPAFPSLPPSPLLDQLLLLLSCLIPVVRLVASLMGYPDLSDLPPSSPPLPFCGKLKGIVTWLFCRLPSLFSPPFHT